MTEPSLKGQRLVEANLRECFRALAADRPTASCRFGNGFEIISLGVRFQMFNAAFLSEIAADENEMERKLLHAGLHFQEQQVHWSFWLCDAFLPDALARRAPRLFSRHGMSHATEMPGMILEKLPSVSFRLPRYEMREVRTPDTLKAFAEIGSNSFRVPLQWFSEVFDPKTPQRLPFRAWVGYRDGAPVATAATVVSDGAIGLYNLATIPEFRSRGFAEAVMRDCIAEERLAHGDLPIVLQSTAAGLPLYERLGFRSVTRFRVYISHR